MYNAIESETVFYMSTLLRLLLFLLGMDEVDLMLEFCELLAVRHVHKKLSLSPLYSAFIWIFTVPLSLSLFGQLLSFGVFSIL